MAHPRTGQENALSNENDLSPAAAHGLQAGGCEVGFTEAGGAAVAALLHLLRLMGAELVLMRADCDPTRFERAVRAKIGQFASPTANDQAREAGLAHARRLVEQVMLQIRAQAALKKSQGPNPARGSRPTTSDPKSAGSKVLN
jgi:hypothetical protein